MVIDNKKKLLMADSSKTKKEIEEEKKKAAEEEKKKLEEEKQKKKDEQKTSEKKNINSVLNKSEDGFDEVKTKLSMVRNILSEDILINNVGFKIEEIDNIKNKINEMNK